MEKESYHHGALREALIEKGIELIREEGVEKFSLRKVANLCGVSHTAPYKHFKNKEELIDDITTYVLEDFGEEIRVVAQQNPGENCLLEIGKHYVTYMLEHKDYFYFMFQSTIKPKVAIKGDEVIYDKINPYGVFDEVASKFLAEQYPDKAQRNLLVVSLWSMVHGIAHLLISGILETDEAYEILTEKILTVICLPEKA